MTFGYQRELTVSEKADHGAGISGVMGCVDVRKRPCLRSCCAGAPKAPVYRLEFYAAMFLRLLLIFTSPLLDTDPSTSLTTQSTGEGSGLCLSYLPSHHTYGSCSVARGSVGSSQTSNFRSPNDSTETLTKREHGDPIPAPINSVQWSSHRTLCKGTCPSALRRLSTSFLLLR